jgi:hypothetical protein
VNSLVFSELVRRVEPLFAKLTLESSNFKVASPVISQERRFRKLFAAFKTFIRFLLVVACSENEGKYFNFGRLMK